MEISQKKALIEQLQTIRNSGNDAISVVITATSGMVEIKNLQVVNTVLDYLLKELSSEIKRRK